jgi:Fe-only nitrogenase accessory protein AnfO
MAREIGAFVDEAGRAAALLQPCSLRIYRRDQGQWRLDRSTPLNLADASGLADLRRRVAEIIAVFGDCKTALAAAFQGAALHEMEKAGIELWEVDGEPTELFDTILLETEKAAQESNKAAALPFPVLENLGEGKFSLSIAEVQRSSGGLTSKQVLLPILQQGSFRELAVLCTHVPPWLEAEANSRGWQLRTEKTNGAQLIATIEVNGK